MKLKVLLCILLCLSVTPVSYAGERDSVIVSLTPSLHGGMIGIKDASRSPLVYNGPLVNASLNVSTRLKTIDLCFDAAYSFGRLGNNIHRDSRQFNHLIELSVGGMTSIYDNNLVSLKAGCVMGGLGDVFVNQGLDRCLHALAIDAKLCASIGLRLSRRVSFVIEDRIPFLSCIMTFNKTDIPLLNPDYTLKAFPGNDFKVKVCRQLKDGRSLMLVMRHDCYSFGRDLSNSFQLQSIELGIAYRFGLSIL